MVSRWILCGLAKDLCAAFETEGPDLGLHLNRSKSLLHIPDGSPPVPNPLPAEIPIAHVGFDLLGAPIGSTSYCDASVHKRVRKVEEVLARLPDLQDSQMKTVLLHFCLALPKVMFALRTCAPSQIEGATSAFDNIMRDALSELASAPLSDWAWLKASLPSSLGGLTIREAGLHAPAAFLSSLDQTSPLVCQILKYIPNASRHLTPALDALARAVGNPDWRSIHDVDVPLRQRCLSHLIDKANYAFLVNSAPDSRFRALALSTAIPHAGDWLSVVPSHALGLNGNLNVVLSV